MKVTLRIHFDAKWGEILFVSGSIEALGNWDENSAFPMKYMGSGEWESVFTTEDNSTFEYKYMLKSTKGIARKEASAIRTLQADAFKHVETRDFWHNPSGEQKALYTKAFTSVLMKPLVATFLVPKNSKHVLRFCINSPRVVQGFSIGIVGNLKELGNWKTPLVMCNANYPNWCAEISLTGIDFPIEYKYVIVSNQSGKIATWEEGNERQVFYTERGSEILHIQNDENFRYPVGNWKGAGVAVPIFSLRSNEGFGVGEFNDLKKLADWCEATGLKMIQTLPINETVATHSWLDPYPYKAISVMALHPIYLNLDELGKIEDEDLMEEFAELKIILNRKPYVDYVEVTKAKSRYCKFIFNQEWKKLKQTDAYKSFFAKNEEWLKPYAAFCYLRDKYKTGDFSQWNEWAKYNPNKIDKLVSSKNKHHEHVAIHYFIQFHLNKQLNEAVEYVHSKGIALKGDIPIGISPQSIEVWTLPKLFNLNGQAGAPPDDFAVLGQNWGFPTYNWDEMAKDGFAWWKKRLQTMANYFDAYRIDHILGFFRIWEIPSHAVHGLLGYFKPALSLSPLEIQDWGIWFNKERFTQPYIRGHFLHEYFGEYTDEVRQLYLTETECNIFELKEGFDTQRKIFNHFTPTDNSDQQLSEKSVIIRDGLMNLCNEVLFIADPYSKHEAYHPRIAMHNTNTYRELELEKKDLLDALYIHYFFKRHDQFWKEGVMKKLPAIIKASNMLVCGEDIGMLPDVVSDVMKELNILSLEVQRTPKNPDIEFGHPADASYLSVCTTSTHNISTIRGWWEEDREKVHRYYNHVLGHSGEVPYIAEPWICREIINQHLHSPAMWAIFPIQDLIAMDGGLRWDETDKERINIPSDSKNKWRYRLILTLEELTNAEKFKKELKSLIEHSGCSL